MDDRDGREAKMEMLQQADLVSITDHAAKLSDLPEEHMADILPACKKLATATVSVQFAVTMRD